MSFPSFVPGAKVKPVQVSAFVVVRVASRAMSWPLQSPLRWGSMGVPRPMKDKPGSASGKPQTGIEERGGGGRGRKGEVVENRAKGVEEVSGCKS